MDNLINYDNDIFKCIDVIPKYRNYHNIYVSKNVHVDEKGRKFQVINTEWNFMKIIHPVVSTTTSRNYLSVKLPNIKGSRRETALVHRLVYLTWCEKIPSNYQQLVINHKDVKTLNNNFSNLELVTQKENLHWDNRIQKAINTRINNGKTNKVVAINIYTKTSWKFNTAGECARQLKLNYSDVNSCIQGTKYRHKDYVFCKINDYSPDNVERLIKTAEKHRRKSYKVKVTSKITGQTFVFDSVKKASEALGITRSNITLYCLGKSKPRAKKQSQFDWKFIN